MSKTSFCEEYILQQVRLQTSVSLSLWSLISLLDRITTEVASQTNDSGQGKQTKIIKFQDFEFIHGFSSFFLHSLPLLGIMYFICYLQYVFPPAP